MIDDVTLAKMAAELARIGGMDAGSERARKLAEVELAHLRGEGVDPARLRALLLGAKRDLVGFTGHLEIPDRFRTHILDDMASTEIADYGPTIAEEMPEGYEGPVERPPVDENYNAQRDTEAILGVAEGRYENVRGRSRETFRDDLTERMRQQAVARVGPNGELLDDFDQKWQEQGGELAALADVAPFARTNPPSVLRGILGNIVTVTPFNNENNPVVAARWDADTDAETTSVTVTIGPPQGLPASAISIRPIAIIDFGTRGVMSRVSVDVGRGIQFTITCSSIIVSFAMVSPSTANLQLTAMLSFKPVVRNLAPTMTIYIDELGAGATSSTFDIPNFAKSLTVWRVDAQDAITLLFQTYFNSTFCQIAIAANATAAETVRDPIKLPGAGDIVKMAVTNPGGGPVSARLVFELAI